MSAPDTVGWRVWYPAAGCTFFACLQDAERLCERLRESGIKHRLTPVLETCDHRDGEL